MEKNKSFDKADHKRELYKALVTSYETGKDQFDTYGKIFLLKRDQDDKEKDQDPSAGSDRGSKRRKSRKDAESSRNSRSSRKSAHAEEPSHTVKDSGVQQDQEFVTVDFRPPQTWISQVARAEEPPTLFNELMDTSFDFSSFVLNRLNITDLDQEILVGLVFNLMKGTCKSITELEYHLEECSNATTERLVWHNPEGKPYPFDLRKPLPLISNHRGQQVIPLDYFINNDLEYLKGGDLSRRYSTLVTNTKATTYEIKWIEDLVQNLWNTMIVTNDKHAYLGISHWGPKRQRFYRYASNLTSSKDVYSRKRIITITRLTIAKKYDYGHLEEIEVGRDDQQLRVKDLQLGVKSYQKKLNLTRPDSYRSDLRNRTAYTSYSDPQGVIYVDNFDRKRLMRADELHKFSDDTLNDVWSSLHDIAKGIRMEYLPKRK
ncbi:hypothetical protein Tco_0996248 [Tanacetum coccineum]